MSSPYTFHCEQCGKETTRPLQTPRQKYCEHRCYVESLRVPADVQKQRRRARRIEREAADPLSQQRKHMAALRRRYGVDQLPPETCDVCGLANPDGRRIHADHDHASGKFRGWLCRTCNLSVGYARDSPLLLEALASYLRANTAAVDVDGATISLGGDTAA